MGEFENFKKSITKKIGGLDTNVHRCFMAHRVFLVKFFFVLSKNL